MNERTNRKGAPAAQPKAQKARKPRATMTHAQRFQKKLDVLANVFTVDVQEAAAQTPKSSPFRGFAEAALTLAKQWNDSVRNLPELAALKGRMRSAAQATTGALFTLSGNALRRALILFKDRPEVAKGPWRLERVDEDNAQYYVLQSTVDPSVMDAVPIRNAARVRG